MSSGERIPPNWGRARFISTTGDLAAAHIQIMINATLVVNSLTNLLLEQVLYCEYVDIGSIARCVQWSAFRSDCGLDDSICNRGLGFLFVLGSRLLWFISMLSIYFGLLFDVVWFALCFFLYAFRGGKQTSFLEHFWSRKYSP